MKDFQLFSILERVGSRGWRGTLESVRRLVGLLNRVQLIVTGGYAKGHCIALYTLSKRILRIYKQSGPVYCGKYLKQVSHCLQRVVSKKDLKYRLDTYVSLTRGGIPRIIPVIYRKRLSGLEPDPIVVKIVLSVCTLYKLMVVLPGNLKTYNLSTIDPVGMPWTDGIEEVMNTLFERGFELLSRLLPEIGKIPLHLGYNPIPILSSGPLTDTKCSLWSFWAKFGLEGLFKDLTSYHTMALDAITMIWSHDSEVLQEYSRIWFSDYTVYPKDTPHSDMDASLERCQALEVYLHSFRRSLDFVYGDVKGFLAVSGRLCRKIEGAGKVRTFAIVSPLMQRFIYPMHEFAMSVLSKIPTDGTYDQHKPLHALSGFKNLYSFDLKAATDLLPAELSKGIVASLFGEDIGDSWFRLLTTVSFRVPRGSRHSYPPLVVCFSRGQPLGFYSSWAVFSLTHHALVVLAAETVYPGERFLNYAILGDDLVIADAKVAAAYSQLIQKSGGVISYDKSLISENGCCEFAKRFIMRNHRRDRVDASPVSMPLIKLIDRYVNPIVYASLGAGIRASFRLRGAGYRVYSQIDKVKSLDHIWGSLSKRWRRQLVGLYSPSGPKGLPLRIWLTFPEFWLLDCYTVGSLYYSLLGWMGCRQLDDESFLAPRLLHAEDDEPWLEVHYAVILKRYLEYVVWYAQASIGMFSLEELARPKMPLLSLTRKTDRIVLQRYGYNYRMWDLARDLRLRKPRILDCRVGLGTDIPIIRIFGVKKYSWIQLFLELDGLGAIKTNFQI